MASAIYRACFAAIQQKQKFTYTIDGQQREAYPHILGHSDGREKLFAFQTGGYSKGGSLPGWRCFFVAKIQLLMSAEDGWRTDDSHTQLQSCVQEVDIDVNPGAKQHYRWPTKDQGEPDQQRVREPSSLTAPSPHLVPRGKKERTIRRAEKQKPRRFPSGALCLCWRVRFSLLPLADLAAFYSPAA